MRYIAQRAGAQDYELFKALPCIQQEQVRRWMQKLCPSFKVYNTEVEQFESIRKLILES